MQKVIIFINIILFFSCSFLRESLGKENEIIIIASPEDRPFIENLMNDLFSQVIYTPQPEPEFSLHFMNPWELDDVQEYGNILITSLDFPQDSTGDYLMQRILQANSQNASVFTLSDLYAKNQIICGIHTHDAISMEKELELRGNWILKEFRDILESRMMKKIFSHGKNDTLSIQISSIIGYTLDLQPDFKIIRKDSLKHFIWIGRGYPYRWITIHKSEKNKYIKAGDAWNYFSLELADLMPTVKIGMHYRNTVSKQFDDSKVHVMRGIYAHSESESGGPFFVYIFDTDSANEVILIGGFVNHPGHQKILLLKQLEIIAKTLHKGDI